jgi:HEAT repeat protein/surface antigen-like variable number repeat protein
MMLSRCFGRCPRFLPLVLASILLAAGAAAQTKTPAPAEPPSYTLAGIDIFGATKTPESVILGIVDVKEGTVITPALVTALDQKLRNTGKFAYSQVSSTDFGNGKSYLSVDVVEKGDEKRLVFNPAPTGTVDVPQDLLDWERRYEKASFQLFQINPREMRDINDGHYIDADEGLRQYQEKMLETVPPNYDVLVKALHEDKDPVKRAQCAILLGYSKNKKAVIIPLEAALKDPVVEVRASAARSLVPIAYLSAHTSVPFPLDPVLEMTHYPTASDRTKSVAVLLQLTADPIYHAAIRERTGGVLVEMAAAHQPAQREHSLTLLTIITGEQYGRDVAKWEAWWKAQKAGTWKPPKPPQPPKKQEPPAPAPSTVKS